MGDSLMPDVPTRAQLDAELAERMRQFRAERDAQTPAKEDMISRADAERLFNKMLDARELALLSQVQQMIAPLAVPEPPAATRDVPLVQYDWPVHIQVRQGPCDASGVPSWQIWLPTTDLMIDRGGVPVPVATDALDGDGPWYTLNGITGAIAGVWAAVLPDDDAFSNWPIIPERCHVKFYKTAEDAATASPSAAVVGMLWKICGVLPTWEVRMLRKGYPLTVWNMGDVEVAAESYEGDSAGMGTAASIGRNPDGALEVNSIRDAAETTGGATEFLARTARNGRTFFGVPASNKGDADSTARTDQNTIKTLPAGSAGEARLGFQDIATSSPTGAERCLVLRNESGVEVQRVLAFAGI